jgi:hypothetical protein
MPPRERRGGRRRTLSPTPTPWQDEAYALWREGLQPVEISVALDRQHGFGVLPEVIERLVLERAADALSDGLGWKVA